MKHYLIATSAFLTAQALATTYDFESGTQGWYHYGATTIFTPTLPALTTVTDAGMNGSKALTKPAVAGTRVSDGAVLNFAPVSLLNGQSITISMDFRYANTPSGSSGDVLGLFFGNQTIPGNTNGAGPSIGAGLNTGGDTRQFDYDTGTGFNMISGPDRTVVGAGGTPLNIGDSLKHTILFSITRSGNDYNLFASRDSITMNTIWLNGYALISSFNSVGVANLNSVQGATFNIDNATLTVPSVPEPSAYGLIGTGVLSTIAFVRRRKTSSCCR